MSDQQHGHSQENGKDTGQLFNDFTPPTYEEWRTAAEKSLKGAPFEKKLITKTYEEIDLQPLYRQEDAATLPHTGSLPGFPPYVRSTNLLGQAADGWDIAQEIRCGSPEMLNQALRADLERGQTAINLVFDRPTLQGINPSDAPTEEVGQSGVSLSITDDLAVVFEGITLDRYPLFIQAGATALPLAAFLFALARQQQQPLDTLRGCLGADPLGTLAHDGTLPCSLEAAFDTMAALIAWTKRNAPGVQTTFVRGHPYHDGGGSATQELAFALATGVTYLREMQSRGIAIDDAATRMRFSFSLGSNVFMEIAKLRAARLLWTKIVGAFGGSEAAQKMVIHTRTSAWNKTAYDPYVNMLRTTTESFAGVVGGTNSLYIAPFDETLRTPDEFSRRIARNTHIILQQESHLNRVIDPAGGSWYIEQLTDSVARKAWHIFQEVERQGGMASALSARYPQAQVAQVAGKRARNIAQRRDIFVGTNMYPNLYEKPLNPPQYSSTPPPRERPTPTAEQEARRKTALETMRTTQGASAEMVEASIEAAHAGATIGELTAALRAGAETGPLPSVEAIRAHRGAEIFEQVRASSESYAARTGKPPQVFLANMGPIPQHKARADFTTGFFEVGGFEMLKNDGFATPEEAARAAIDSGAPIVVICSTDDTYPELVPPLVKLIKAEKPDTMVILAGYPADQVEAHQAAGVDAFVHLRANCHEMLVNLQQKIGVAP
jgi:methylmalonyl-CoA mutase